jgi:hypothetical protein
MTLRRWWLFVAFVSVVSSMGWFSADWRQNLGNSLLVAFVLSAFGFAAWLVKQFLNRHGDQVHGWARRLDRDSPRRTMLAVILFGAIAGPILSVLLWKLWLALPQPEKPDKTPAVSTVDATRPWLFIVNAQVEASTKRINLTVQNRGQTPAYDVYVEDWAEISKLIPKYAKVEPFEGDTADFLAKQEKMRFFDKEFDTRIGRLPDYGGRSGSMRSPMLIAGQSFDYMLSADPVEMAKALKLEQPRQVRFVGRISYTDVSKQLKPDFQFCYQTYVIRDKAGNVTVRVMACPDQDMNASR